MTNCHFNTELWLPRPREEIFEFFADAHNLESITPPWLKFRILTPGHIVMRRGAWIDYRLRLHGIPLRWHTEITAWEPPRRFVDEQIRGPFRRWVHTHTFEERDGGTLCSDDVEYCAPGGRIADRLLVRHDVEKIFKYRRSALLRHFNVDESTVSGGVKS